MTAQEETAVSSPIEETWRVWRQDDYSNRFEVRQGLSQADALRLVAEFEARGHKQSYWAEPGSIQGPPSR
jgi:UDP-N-acetyl-2-amino-2-deoxyglucuronate dehydrogenase